MDLAPIVAIVLANAIQFKRTMAEVVATADATGQAAGKAGSSGGKMLDVMGTAALGVGVAAVHMAGDFNLATARIQTDGGEQANALGQVRGGILDLMGQVGDSAQQLEAGMNTVESAGFHAANGGLNVLKIAAEGAKVGNADLAVMTDALTSDLNAYGQSASSAAADTDQMIATVAAGKLHMQDLASSLSTVLPIAAANKVAYAQIGGALATMTMQGVSAQQGTQNLASTIRALGNPNNVAIKTMQQLGLSANQVSQDLSTKGLTGVLGELHQAVESHMGPDGLAITSVLNKSASAAQDANTMLKALPASLQSLATAYLNGTATQAQWNAAVKQLPATQANLAQQFAATARTANSFNDMLRVGNPQARTYAALMGDMLGGQDGLNTALMLTGPHMAAFTGNVDSIAKAAKGAGSDVKDWDVIQGQFNTKLDQAKGTAEALGIRLGNTLLPVAQQLLATTMGLVDWFGKHKVAADALAVVVGGALTIATVGYFAKMTKGLADTVVGFGTFVGEAGGKLGKVTGFLGETGAKFGSFAVTAAGRLGSAAAGAGSFALSAGQSLLSAGRAAAGFAVEMGAMAARAAASFAAMAADALVWAGEMLAAGAEALLPFLPIIAVVAAVGLAAYELYTHWNTVWSFVKSIVGDATDWIKKHLDLIIDVALGPLGIAITYLSKHWQEIWTGIRTVVSDIWNNYLRPVFDAISGAISSISNGLGSIGHAASSIGSFLGFDEGGWVPGGPGSPMLAVVHGGEFVMSRDMLAGRASVDSGVGSAVLGGLAQSSATGPSGGGAASSVTNHQVIIQAGAVISDQDLVALVQRGFLRQGARYSTSYTPFHR
jgi:hypothetical protein